MSYVDEIVKAFGGVRPMATSTGYAVSTVMSWKRRGSIPDAHKPAVLKVAKENDIGLEEADFFPIVEKGAA